MVEHTRNKYPMKGIFDVWRLWMIYNVYKYSLNYFVFKYKWDFLYGSPFKRKVAKVVGVFFAKREGSPLKTSGF